LEMAANMLGNEARKKLELVPLSNNVIPSQIADFSLVIWNKLSHKRRLVP